MMSDSIVLDTQAQIDSFAINYPDCTEIPGDIWITGYNQVTNLEGLSHITKIEGNLTLSRLGSFVGLEGLNTVLGSVTILTNTCSDFTGLNNLVHVGDYFDIHSNNLTSFEGLENLNYIGASLVIRYNDNLASLEGLNNLSQINGALILKVNPLLTSIKALNNANMQGSLHIEDNFSLENLDGLTNVQTLNNFKLHRNSIQTLAHLENLNYIAGNFAISLNNPLTNLEGLGGLDSIGGNIFIDWNNGLHNLDGLENLKSAGGDIFIRSNFQLENITALGNLTLIGGQDSLAKSLSITGNNQLDNLDGLEGITALKRLTVKDNDLQDIDALQNLTYVERVDIESSSLTNVLGLQNITSIAENLTIKLNGNNTNLQGLESITSVGGNVEIWGVHSLSGLNNLATVGGNTAIHSNSILNLDGLNSLETVSGHLVMQDCSSLLTINGLENLRYVGGNLSFIDNDNLTSLQALTNLNTINGILWILDNNVLTTLTGLENVTHIGRLWIRNNVALTTLEALSNVNTIENMVRISENSALTSLAGLDYVNYTDVDEIEIRANVNLSLCSMPSLCDYIIQGGETDIAYNGQTCSDVDAVLNYCEEITRLQTITFYDINQNKMQDDDESEVFVGSVSFEPDMIYLHSNPVNQNLYYTPPGAYTVTYDPLLNADWQLTTDSASYFVSLEEGELEEVKFGIYPTEQISKIVTTITSPPTRCNDFITFDITTKNLGTTIVSGTTWFQTDENIQQIEFIDQPDTTIITSLDHYGWYFTDLYPGYAITKQVSIQIPGPPDFPVGGWLNFGAFSQFVDINGEDTSEGFRYNPDVRCSYDPNDKLVNPKRHNDYTLFDEDIIYTIRFQNTGNDVAYDVVIKDTLDANLNHSTFRVLGSSHADKLSTSMNDAGVVNFEFRNIFLPDSTANLEGSQGYVTYLIRANEGLPEYTGIQNSAGIYFDQNPPVLTNTTLNVMVSELPTVSTTPPDESPDFRILPNPTTGIYEVQGIREGTYKIFNTAGQHLQSGDMKNNMQIDISDMPQGVYFMSVTVNHQNIVKRIIKI